MEPKIVCGLMLKNENRYIFGSNDPKPPYTMLEQCLGRISDFSDEIVIVDNNSTDGSQEVYKAFPKVVSVQQNGEVDFDDVRDRRWLVDEARKRGATIFAMFDGDEVVEDQAVPYIRSLTKSFGIFKVKFRYVNPWRCRRNYRTDKWHNTSFYRLWSMEGLSVVGTALHNYGLVHSGRTREIFAPYVVVHYGWADWEHRTAKSMRYARQHAQLHNIPLADAERYYRESDLAEDGIQLAPLPKHYLAELQE